MKRYLIGTLVLLIVLAVTWTVVGQEQSERAQRFARYRQAQTEAIEMIQKQAAKLNAAMEETSRRDFGSWQDLSEEERTKLRERFTKMREERQKTLETIEHQVAILKGSRRLTAEHDESIAELKQIQDLAEKEDADETAKHVEQLIAKRQKQFEQTLEKLGLEPRR